MTEQTRTLIDAAVEHLPTPLVLTGEVPGVAVELLPAGTRIGFHDLEKYEVAPRRIRAAAVFETPQGFVGYVSAFAGAPTRLFASLEKRQVVAAIDYHEPAGPSWSTHRAVYPAQFAPAFAAWMKVHDQYIGQRDFAEFLEDRAEDAIAPDPADLMEVAQKFDAVRAVDFKSAINLSTNERQFRYEEKDSVGGAIACPKRLSLRTPVFWGSDPVVWQARFSYKIESGALLFKVAIHRCNELLDTEFERLCDAIAVDLPALPLHRGIIG